MALRAVVFDYGMVLTGLPDPAAHAELLRITGLLKVFSVYPTLDAALATTLELIGGSFSVRRPLGPALVIPVPDVTIKNLSDPTIAEPSASIAFLSFSQFS